MATKICSKCGIEQDVSMFHKSKSSKDGLKSMCKKCNIEKAKNYVLKNKDKVKKYQHEYRLKNKDKAHEYRVSYFAEHKKEILDKQKEYYKKNKEKIAKTSSVYYSNNKEEICKKAAKYYETNKEICKEKNKRYRESNREKIYIQKKEYHLSQMETNPVYRLKMMVRRNVRDSFLRTGNTKNAKTEEIVGCSIDFLVEYLKQTYFDRYGEEYIDQEVHIDHIIPLKTATSEREVIALCHYSNLQLLTPKDNLEKGAKLLEVCG